MKRNNKNEFSGNIKLHPLSTLCFSGGTLKDDTAYNVKVAAHSTGLTTLQVGQHTLSVSNDYLQNYKSIIFIDNVTGSIDLMKSKEYLLSSRPKMVFLLSHMIFCNISENFPCYNLKIWQL